MLILFDNNVPKPLRRSLNGHVVRTAYQMNWFQLQNGSLLRAAERAGFDLLITAARIWNTSKTSLTEPSA